MLATASEEDKEEMQKMTTSLAAVAAETSSDADQN